MSGIFAMPAKIIWGAYPFDVSVGTLAPGMFMAWNGNQFVPTAPAVAPVPFSALSDVAALGVNGSASDSTIFVDCGDGTTSGFTSWTVSVPTTRTYMFQYVCGALILSTPNGQALFQLLVDGVAVTQPTSTAQYFAPNNIGAIFGGFVTATFPVPLTAGPHTFKLQFKPGGSYTVDTLAGRTFTMWSF